MHRSARSRRTNNRDILPGKSFNPLLEPIDKGHLATVTEMIKSGGKQIPSDQLDEALIKAAGYGQAELCELLASSGADVNTREDRDAFLLRLESSSSFTPDQAIRHAWLQHHSSVGGTPLHRAAEGGHTATVGVLLQAGARVNEADENGMTPLMLACMRRGSSEIVRKLLQSPGCTIDIKEKRVGRTAVHFAAHVGDKNSLTLLLEYGGEVDTRDNIQNTPLMLATTPLRFEEPHWPPSDVKGCINILISHGAFVNLVNRDSESALQRALEIEEGGAVELLLSHNALSHPSVLRDACLTYKDVGAIEKLLAMGGGFSGTDENLLAILICLICDDSSQWMLNAKQHEKVTHDIARLLISYIRDWYNTVAEVLKMGEKDLQTLFGEEYFLAFLEKYKQDVLQFGVFGAALKHGKYSIAKMLYRVGSDIEPMRTLKDSSLCEYLCLQPWLCSWLPKALHPSEEKGEGSKEKADDASSTFDVFSDIEPYDILIRENEDNLLNQCYSNREESQAARERTLWLYQ